jgi:hypothetical protein
MSTDVQALIDILTSDADRALADLQEVEQAEGPWTYARVAVVNSRGQQLQGLRVALGRVLAWRDGIGPEHPVDAFYRGRDYQDQHGGGR